MRPFGELLEEILGIEQAMIRGVGSGDWTWSAVQLPHDVPWRTVDAVREHTATAWPGLDPEALAAVSPDPFGWGLPPQSHVDRLQYALENEIHHRGQGYVYLRLLGVEPPPFWKTD